MPRGEPSTRPDYTTTAASFPNPGGEYLGDVTPPASRPVSVDGTPPTPPPKSPRHTAAYLLHSKNTQGAPSPHDPLSVSPMTTPYPYSMNSEVSELDPGPVPNPRLYGSTPHHAFYPPDPRLYGSTPHDFHTFYRPPTPPTLLPPPNKGTKRAAMKAAVKAPLTRIKKLFSSGKRQGAQPTS